jgi:hypothetical protein
MGSLFYLTSNGRYFLPVRLSQLTHPTCPYARRWVTEEMTSDTFQEKSSLYNFDASLQS